ncbi:MAG: hypothetical protein M0Z40_03130 [Actinomycetota bacterium]|nr:hypothetical protein [Actinomycetota bacterium]
MSRPLLVRVHLAASAGAVAVITGFLASSTITELTGGVGDIRVLRHGILLGLPLLVACLATAGLTGRRLAGASRSAVVRHKQRRLQVAAAVGLAVLVPCALILNHLAAAPATGRLFATLEVTEFLFGSLNLSLLALNFRDGRRMTRHRGPAQLAHQAGSRP